MPETIASTQLYVFSQVLGREGKGLAENLDAVLADVKAAGYPALEGDLALCGTPEKAAGFKALLDKHGLKCPSVYTGGNLYDPEKAPATVEQIASAAGHAAQVGVRGITMNPDVIREGKTDAQLKTQAKWLNELGTRLKQKDVGLWIHNHDPEMKDNGREVRHNLDNTDHGVVGFCADVHWIWRGGGDPYEYLDRYGARLGNLHLRNSMNKVWSETFGEGDLDYRKVADLLKKHRFEGPLIVELAIEKGTPQTQPQVESQRQSREYLRKVFGV